MPDKLPSSPSHPVDNPAMDRLLTWADFGVVRSWIEDSWLPVCQHYQEHLVRGETQASIADLARGEGDWDILLIGEDTTRIQEPGDLEFIIGKIIRARPLDCIVAVIAGQSLDDELSLLRAGALDVLRMDADTEQTEQVLEHAIETAQARRVHLEQDKLRLLSQLAVSVNHEINNPLTGLMGTAELLLLEGRALDEKVRRDLQTIIKQCHRIQEVTARLKTLNHLRTVPYGSHDQMIDLIGQIEPIEANVTGASVHEQFLPTPRILVVDDNPLIIDLIVRLFEQRFLIDAASCASDALAKVEQSQYDLILIDLILPEMNGLELYRAIRRKNPRQKAMLTTAYEGDARVEQAIVEGALGCIFKPFQLEELETALTEAVKLKNA